MTQEQADQLSRQQREVLDADSLREECSRALRKAEAAADDACEALEEAREARAAQERELAAAAAAAEAAAAREARGAADPRAGLPADPREAFAQCLDALEEMEKEGPRACRSWLLAYREALEFRRRGKEQQTPPKVYSLVGKSASEVAALEGQVSQAKLSKEELPPWEQVRRELLM